MDQAETLRRVKSGTANAAAPRQRVKGIAVAGGKGGGLAKAPAGLEGLQEKYGSKSGRE